MMKTIQLSALGKFTFMGSFLLETVILIISFITKDAFWLFMGFYYVIAAVMTNVLIFLYELSEFLGDISEKKSQWKLSTANAS